MSSDSKFADYTTKPLVREQVGVDRAVGYIMVHVEDEVRVVSNLEPASFRSLLQAVLDSLSAESEAAETL